VTCVLELFFALWTRYNHTDYDPCFIHQREWLWHFHPRDYDPCFIHQESGCDIFIQEIRGYGIIRPIDSQCWYLVPTSRLLLNWRLTVMGYNSCPDSQSERWDSHFHQLQSTEKPISDSSSQLRWHMDPHFVIGGSLSADFLGTNFAFFTTKKIWEILELWNFSSINITNLQKFLGKIHQIFSITKLRNKNPGPHF